MMNNFANCIIISPQAFCLGESADENNNEGMS